MAVSSSLNLQVNLTGKNDQSPITPVNVNVPILNQGAFSALSIDIPASGSPVVVPMPPVGTQQSFFMLVSDLPVGVQLNSETALTPGVAPTVLPALVLRTGGPNITSVTITPGGTEATVSILIAGK